jgi:hypothetical protein
MENICTSIPALSLPLELNTANLDEIAINLVAASEEVSITSTTLEALELIEVSEITEVPEIPEALEVPKAPEVFEKLTEEDLQPLLIKENEELKSLIKTVAHLDQENSLLNFAVQDMLSKFDQIIGIISENAPQDKQEAELPPFDELEPVKEAMSHLEKETQSLSQVLRVMLVKQEERDSSLEKLETQICQLQSEKDDLKNKGGFWNKWIT